MSNELLRIHDENNNCDLVAVANPMGNFHMSTYAEMQDGTQKPVDGWYLFSKMIEKLGQGGTAWPEDVPLPAPDGFGWRHYLTKNSQVSETSGITTQNTMYLVQDLSEENLATIRAGLKQDKVGPWNPYEISCEFYSGSFQTWMPVEVSKYTTTKYEDSGENYYAEDGYQRFHMIFDRTKLSDEDAALFPKNGIYFEYHRNKAPTSISKARSAIYLKNGDPCKYSKIGDALYVKSSDGTKVMKITVASDGTITTTEA